MYQLPELPYAKNELAPIITEEGFDYHHGKHHLTYITNLNNLIKDTELEMKSIEEIIDWSAKENQTALFNNAAQHFNHDFYWKCLSPNSGGKSVGLIDDLLTRDFGGYENFKSEFSEKATKLFGSGWTWLVQDLDGKLEILALKDANTPLLYNKKPLLTLDVWEHAYYIDHRNARPKFIDGFWEIVNWDFANLNLKK